jgi:hypothetical protein
MAKEMSNATCVPHAGRTAAAHQQCAHHHHHHQITKLSHSINAIGPAPHRSGKKREHRSIVFAAITHIPMRTSHITTQKPAALLTVLQSTQVQRYEVSECSFKTMHASLEKRRSTDAAVTDTHAKLRAAAETTLLLAAAAAAATSQHAKERMHVC